MPLLDPEVSEKFGTLQSLDDAIAFRFGRLQRPCLDCTGTLRCAEHAFDAHLLQLYKVRYAAASADAFASMDPSDIGGHMQAGDVPPTAATLRAAVAARLREATTAEPIVVELDRLPVAVELHGQALAEYFDPPPMPDQLPRLLATGSPPHG